MEDQTGLVRITNHNEKAITGRYSGVDYHFRPGNPVDVPEIVARHIFAFGNDDKTMALARLGWALNSEQIESALEKLAKVTFEDPPEMIEAPPKPKRMRSAKETSPAGPPVEAGGSEGGALKAPPNGPRVGELESDNSESQEDF